MRSSYSTAGFFLLLGLLFEPACSLVIKIDDDKYTSGSGSSDDLGMGEGGALVDGDGDGDGDLGGAEAAPMNNGGGSGDGDGDENGTGGETALLTPPDADHYYPLDMLPGGVPTDQGVSSSPINGNAYDNQSWLPDAGVRGGAYEVESGDQAFLEFGSSLASSGPITMSWWFSQTAGGLRDLVNKADLAMGVGGFIVYSDNRELKVRIGDSTPLEIGTDHILPSVSDAEWTHIVFSYVPNANVTRDRVQLWINGEEVYDDFVLLPNGTKFENTAQPLRFGKQQGVPILNPFIGLLDELRIYESELTDAEIKSLYTYDSPDAE